MSEQEGLRSIFDAEPLIVARLREQLPAGVQVLTADDLAQLKLTALPERSVHVIYNSYTVSQTGNNGRTAMVAPSWLVVVVVKHEGAQSKAAAEAKQRASQYIVTVLDALMGFRPDARRGTPGLELGTPPKPVSVPPYYFFPNLFTAQVPVTSRSNAHV